MGVTRREREVLGNRAAWSTVFAILAISRSGWAEPAAPPASAPAQSTAAAGPATSAPAAPAPAAPAAAAAPPKVATQTAVTAPKLSAAAALRAATQGLASASPSEVRKGLLALAELGGDGAARALAKRMHAGLPPALLGDAIDVAVQLGSPLAVPELVDLLQHKRAAVRKHALDALAALKAKSAQSAMLIALDDPDADVRRSAVAALTELGNARALPALLALVQHGQPGALEAVGKLAAARDLATLLEHAPGGDVTQLKPALAGWLAVASRSPGQQLELVTALTKVASPSARTYLVEWLDAAKSSGNPRVRQALFTAIKQLDQTAEVASTTTKTTRTTVQGVQVIARADAPAPAPVAGAGSAGSAGPAVASSSPTAAHTEAAR